MDDKLKELLAQMDKLLPHRKEDFMLGWIADHIATMATADVVSFRNSLDGKFPKRSKDTPLDRIVESALEVIEGHLAIRGMQKKKK